MATVVPALQPPSHSLSFPEQCKQTHVFNQPLYSTIHVAVAVSTVLGTFAMCALSSGSFFLVGLSISLYHAAWLLWDGLMFYCFYEWLGNTRALSNHSKITVRVLLAWVLRVVPSIFCVGGFAVLKLRASINPGFSERTALCTFDQPGLSNPLQGYRVPLRHMLVWVPFRAQVLLCITEFFLELLLHALVPRKTGAGDLRFNLALRMVLLLAHSLAVEKYVLPALTATQAQPKMEAHSSQKTTCSSKSPSSAEGCSADEWKCKPAKASCHAVGAEAELIIATCPTPLAREAAAAAAVSTVGSKTVDQPPAAGSHTSWLEQSLALILKAASTADALPTDIEEDALAEIVGGLYTQLQSLSPVIAAPRCFVDSKHGLYAPKAGCCEAAIKVICGDSVHEEVQLTLQNRTARELADKFVLGQHPGSHARRTACVRGCVLLLVWVRQLRSSVSPPLPLQQSQNVAKDDWDTNSSKEKCRDDQKAQNLAESMCYTALEHCRDMKDNLDSIHASSEGVICSWQAASSAMAELSGQLHSTGAHVSPRCALLQPACLIAGRAGQLEASVQDLPSHITTLRMVLLDSHCQVVAEEAAVPLRASAPGTQNLRFSVPSMPEGLAYLLLETPPSGCPPVLVPVLCLPEPASLELAKFVEPAAMGSRDGTLQALVGDMAFLIESRLPQLSVSGTTDPVSAHSLCQGEAGEVLAGLLMFMAENQLAGLFAFLLRQLMLPRRAGDGSPCLQLTAEAVLSSSAALRAKASAAQHGTLLGQLEAAEADASAEPSKQPVASGPAANTCQQPQVSAALFGFSDPTLEAQYQLAVMGGTEGIEQFCATLSLLAGMAALHALGGAGCNWMLVMPQYLLCCTAMLLLLLPACTQLGPQRLYRWRLTVIAALHFLEVLLTAILVTVVGRGQAAATGLHWHWAHDIFTFFMRPYIMQMKSWHSATTGVLYAVGMMVAQRRWQPSMLAWAYYTFVPTCTAILLLLLCAEMHRRSSFLHCARQLPSNHLKRE